MTNALFQCLEGDLPSIAAGPAYLRALILPGEAALFSAEDLIASFYLVKMPLEWHRWFTFRLPVKARDLGLDWDGDVYLATVVLPMGFSCATGFMQAWHRRLALFPPSSLCEWHAGLPAHLEVRGDRPFPLSAADGERSGWSIYIDDFLEMQVLMELVASAREGMVSSHQGTIRISYSDSGVPRNEPKTVQSASLTEHVGYLPDGKSGWVGITTFRLLEIIAIGFHFVRMGRCPLLFLRVFAGKAAHALQVKWPLWSFLFHNWESFPVARAFTRAALPDGGCSARGVRTHLLLATLRCLCQRRP